MRDNPVSCPEHGRLCAFRGDEPDRCPWCHSTWTHVLATRVHSCESRGGVWSGPDTDWRVDRAAAMRREAAVKVDRGTHGGRADPSATPVPLSRQGRF